MKPSNTSAILRELVAFLLLLGLAFPALGASYELPTVKAELVGMSSERLDRIGSCSTGS